MNVEQDINNKVYRIYEIIKNIGIVDGVGISKIISISQSDYDNLQEKDPQTLYVIN